MEVPPLKILLVGAETKYRRFQGHGAEMHLLKYFLKNELAIHRWADG